MVYARGKEIPEGSNIFDEARDIYEALKFCLENDNELVELHTDSMLLKNTITGE